MKKIFKYSIFMLILLLIPFFNVKADNSDSITYGCRLYCLATGGVTDECMNTCETNANQVINSIHNICNDVCLDDENCNSSCIQQYINQGLVQSCSNDECVNDFIRTFLLKYNASNPSTSMNISTHCLQACDYGHSCVPGCVESVRSRCATACGNDKANVCVNNCVNEYADSDYYCTDGSCDNDFFTKYGNVVEQRRNGGSSSGSSGGSGNYVGGDTNVERTPLTCDDVKYATFAYNALRIIAPLLLIIFGSLDFLKAVIAGDVKKQQEARSKFPKRIIAFVLLILLPFVVGFLFKTLGQYGSSNLGIFCCIATNGSEQCNVVISNSYEDSNNHSNNSSDKTSSDSN